LQEQTFSFWCISPIERELLFHYYGYNLFIEEFFIKLLNKRIDVISRTSKNGKITSVRFRMEEETPYRNSNGANYWDHKKCVRRECYILTLMCQNHPRRPMSIQNDLSLYKPKLIIEKEVIM